MPVLVASYASLKRIETFLLLDEKNVKSDGSDSDSDISSEKVTLNEKGSLPASSSFIGDCFLPIKMSSASFSWDPESEAFLRDISLTLSQPQLYVCVGSVASVSERSDCYCSFVSNRLN